MAEGQEKKLARILVVEDETIIAADLALRLERFGYVVTAMADSAEEALRQVEQNPPDLVLTDIVLKGPMDGVEVADIIRSRYGLPVVFITAYVEQERLERAKMAYPFGYILKPFQDRDLKVTIKMALYVAGLDEQRRAGEEALRYSEERYRALAEATFDAVFISENGYCIDTNTAAAKMFGYSYDESIGIFGTDVIAEESKETVRHFMLSGYEEPYEAMAQKKDGTRFHVEIRGKMTEYKGRRVRVTVVHDIDQRKKAEQRYRRLTENAQDMIYRMSLPEGRYEFVNQAAKEMLGYAPEEFYLSPALIERIMHPDWKDYFAEQWALLLKGQAPPTYEYQVVTKAGETKWMHQRNVIVRDEQGRPMAIEGIVTDITKRKRDEEILRTSEENYRFMTENVTDVLWQATPDLRFTYLSPAEKKLRGYDPEELIGRSALSFMTPQSAARLKEHAQARQAQHEQGLRLESESLELESYCQDGSLVWTEVVATPVFGASGELTGFQGVTRNINDRKKAEEALKREQEKFQILVDESPLGVSLIGRDGRYKYLNPKFTEMFGYTLEDLPRGQDWFTLAYPDIEYRTGVLKTWLADLKNMPVGAARPRTYKVTCKNQMQKEVLFLPVTMSTGDQFVTYQEVNLASALGNGVAQGRSEQSVE